MAFSLTWLPKVLMDEGLKVALVPGWQTRGRGNVGPIFGVICHHTAGGKNGNMPSLNTLIKGRPKGPKTKALPGPLAQLGLGRDGTFYVIAAGRCNHAGAGEWEGHTNGNANFIGIEAENTGLKNDFPWPAKQLEAYHHGVAAILRHIGESEKLCAGHKEYALPKGRKPDPDLNMVDFREEVRKILKGDTPKPALIPALSGAQLTLRRGATGALVKTLQAKLGVQQTGLFGPTTEAQVREFQRKHNLVPDGIVGPKTWALL